MRFHYSFAHGREPAGAGGAEADGQTTGSENRPTLPTERMRTTSAAQGLKGQLPGRTWKDET